jgi:hypothetical protein
MRWPEEPQAKAEAAGADRAAARVGPLDQLGFHTLPVLTQIGDLEADHRHIGLVAVLLPEQPFEHLGAIIASAGISTEPSARCSMMALDCERTRPSSKITIGTWPAGFMERKSAVRVSAFRTLVSIHSKGRRSRSAVHFTFRQLPEIESP